MTFPNYYRTLGVHRGSSVPETRDAFYRLSKLHHPDSPGGGDNAGLFSSIAYAWSILSHSDRRRQYERQLDALGARCGACSGRGYRREQVSFHKVIDTGCIECDGAGVRAR